MNDADVIAYLRSKAAAFTSAADALEGTAAPEKKQQPSAKRTEFQFDATKRPPPNFNLVSGQATPEGIRNYVSSKSARPADLAKHFNTSETQIKAIVEDPSNGLLVADRGWIKLREDWDALQEHLNAP